jgi:hypothetical protein
MTPSAAYLRAFRPVTSMRPACSLTTVSPSLSNLNRFHKCEEQPFRLIYSAKDAEVFFDACENPPAPSDEMREMMKDVLEWLK